MRTRTSLLSLSLAGLLGVAALAQTPPPGALTPPPRPGDTGREAPPPQERRPDVSGRVTSVSADGRTLTIATPPRPGPDGQPPARDARGEQATVNVSDRTQMLFFGVGEGEARPAPGLMAMVWLDEGSRDQAARVRFMRREGDERPDVQGRILSVAPDGRSITVETRDQDRPAGRTEIRLAPYTQAQYFGVDRDGARPTPDYLVVAWFEKGSKDTAARIRFMKSDGRDMGPGGPGGVPPAR